MDLIEEIKRLNKGNITAMRIIKDMEGITMSIINKAYRNGKSLHAAIDKADYFPEFKEHLESLEEYQRDGEMEMYYDSLHWIDYHNMTINEDIDADNITLEYCPGWYCQPIGTIRPDTGQILAGTLPAVLEIEIQANDGVCAYHYLGDGFFEVWVNKEDYIGEINE